MRRGDKDSEQGGRLPLTASVKCTFGVCKALARSLEEAGGTTLLVQLSKHSLDSKRR